MSGRFIGSFKQFCLYTWQLAIQSFYEHSEQSFETEPPVLEDIDDPEQSSSSTMSSQPSKKDTNNNQGNSSRPVQGSAKIATLSSLKKEDEDSGGQAFYAGGSETSGQQVLGPKSKKNPESIVKDMFKQAKENALVVDPESKAKKSNAFTGSGFTLGTNENDSSQVPGRPSTSKSGSDSDDEQETILRLWRNGFTVDDGPLREYEDPSNEQFLAAISRGEVPPELTKGSKKYCNLQMEDHRTEEYQPPKKKPAKAFGGEGHRLGSPATEFVTNLAPAAANPEQALSQANEYLSLNPSEGNTKIQIRLADGSRYVLFVFFLQWLECFLSCSLVAHINLNKLVSDLRQFICIARPEYAAVPFTLQTTFPNKVIDNETATIQDSGLANAAVVQRLAWL